VGYLAEDGGTIRATNGNNSYGTYGSVSLGIDTDEIPKVAYVNNRNSEAIVRRAFAGEISDDSGELDRILVFEYANCGEDYSYASAKIQGSGALAITRFDDVRNGAIFESRRLDPGDSSFIGGIGYTNRQNQAQLGDLTTIKLSVNDLNTADDYVGQRIVLISGPGTGQYGYISAYQDDPNISATYRQASIKKESTDEDGWDHIVPGTTIEPALTAGTQYRIEPRVSVPEPLFTTDLKLTAQTNIPIRYWTDITFGPTAELLGTFELDAGTSTRFDEVRLTAKVSISKIGDAYTVTLIDEGSGYKVNDTTVIAGNLLGGNTPDNDLFILAAETTDDSTDSILNISYTGIAYSYKWVMISQGNTAMWSNNGLNWTSSTLPVIQQWEKVIAGNNIFVAISLESTNKVAYSIDGKNWGQGNLPSTEELRDITFGDNLFVIICNNNNKVFYSTNGSEWLQSNIPTSSSSSWASIAFGFDKFLIISSGSQLIATSSDAVTWELIENILPVENYNFVNLEFNGGRFIALIENSNEVLVCIDSLLNVWNLYTLPTPGTITYWTNLKYSNGLFVLTNIDIENRYILTSSTGIVWDTRDLGKDEFWVSIGNGQLSSKTTKWIVIAHNDSNIMHLNMGAKPFMRTNITSSTITEILIIDPGSGYNTSPDITIFDNSATAVALFENRIGNGVLAQPTFVHRGIGYRTSSTTVTITGDGYGDFIPSNTNFITIDKLDRYPGPGAQIEIEGITEIDENTGQDITRIFTLVSVVPLGFDEFTKTYKAQVRLSPKVENQDNLQHSTPLTIRERYSQCRITGHDFLDIGTGNFIQTNYPELYADGAYFVSSPENEVYEANGGRVFYASTDQDGNFRGGELFAVEQATGIVTISADFFALEGLSELSLGGVRLGGTGTVVRDFSTDPNFTEDSNNVVPTQRALITFLENRISQGGSELELNSITAGTIQIGTVINLMEQKRETIINFTKPINFAGSRNTGIRGTMLAQYYYSKS